MTGDHALRLYGYNEEWDPVEHSRFKRCTSAAFSVLVSDLMNAGSSSRFALPFSIGRLHSAGRRGRTLIIRDGRSLR